MAKTKKRSGRGYRRFLLLVVLLFMLLIVMMLRFGWRFLLLIEEVLKSKGHMHNMVTA